MPTNAALARKQKASSSTRGKKVCTTLSSAAVTSHVFRASAQLQSEFDMLWNVSMKKTKSKKVIRDGSMIITIYK